MSTLQPRSVVVVGAGGHAKVVISLLQAAGETIAMVVDDDPRKWGTSLLGVPIKGPVTRLAEATNHPAIVAIGDNAAREEIASQWRHVDWLTAVHPRAYVHSSVQLRPGAVVCAGAVIQPDTLVGAHVIVNTAATVDHDCVVEDYAHLAPGVHLAGGVRIGEGALLGIGSVVIPGRRVGEWTTVGAGGVVVSDLPARVMAVGVPARL
jgi:sugar O-acyltransferase (sialic acid O-acetyltransferase NeuD family)